MQRATYNCSLLALFLLAITISVVSRATAADPENAPPPKNPLAGIGSAAPATKPAGAFMRFQVYVLNDTSENTGEVTRFLIPAGWQVDGGVKWNFFRDSPAYFQFAIFNPNGPEALACYPNMEYFWSRSSARDPNFGPGKYYGGAIVRSPVSDDIFQIMQQVFIPEYRRDLMNARVVETAPLPKMVEAAKQSFIPRPGVEYFLRAGRMRLEYQVGDQPVQEDITAMFVVTRNQRLGSMSWALRSINSIRAATGKLDDVRAIQRLSLQSSEPNLVWFDKLNRFIDERHKASIRGSLRAGEIARAFAAMNNRISEETRRKAAENKCVADTTHIGATETLRDQQPYDTPGGGILEAPITWGHVWQGADGQTVFSNNALYDPNSDPSLKPTNWTELQKHQR